MLRDMRDRYALRYRNAFERHWASDQDQAKEPQMSIRDRTQLRAWFIEWYRAIEKEYERSAPLYYRDGNFPAP